jgi:hypothetical protein
MNTNDYLSEEEKKQKEIEKKNLQRRFILFIFGCILVRLILVYLSKTYMEYLPFFGVLALMAVVGWINVLFFNERNTGPEVMGGKIWWNKVRPVHTVLFSIFGILALQKNKSAWMFLLIDTFIGLSAFLMYHYTVGNFSKLV